MLSKKTVCNCCICIRGRKWDNLKKKYNMSKEDSQMITQVIEENYELGHEVECLQLLLDAANKSTVKQEVVKR